MNARQARAALGVVAVAVMTACSNTTTGLATAPEDVTPLTTTTTRSTPTQTSEAPGGGAADLPPEAYAEVRAAGLEGSDDAIRDQIIIACIMGESSFNTSKQDVVDALIQMGSNLPPDALMTIVTVGLKYECPELAGKLGG